VTRSRITLIACLVYALCPIQGKAAQGGNVPDEAKALVVRIVSYFEEGAAPEVGAGIIFSATTSELSIATARHVVKRDMVARSIWVAFSSGDSVQTTSAPRISTSLDLAVLRVAGDPARVLGWTPRSWDRLGSVRSLRSDDPVSAVGCPQGVCWQAPAPPDRIVGIDRLGVLFQSSFVGRGSSGGALFNAWWEVVGMVTEDAPPRANAIRIDEVLAQAKAWGGAVNLRHPTVPRAGYGTSFVISWLVPIAAAHDPYAGNRLPSGRVLLVGQTRSLLTWHVSLLRLAPDNLAVNAGMAGGALSLRRGRFTFVPFVEAGLGRVEGRFDAGGYYVATGNPQSPSRYVPFWNQRKQDGIGVGGGLQLSAILAPHVILDVVAGHWSFTVPDSLPRLPDLFVGAGLRWGL
jgi:trypsin-like peptidase